MVRVSRFLGVAALAVFMLLAAAPAAPCAVGQEKYIRFVSAENGKITLEVDGKKLSFPMPDGYELMKEEHNPNEYNSIKKTPHQLLCILIDNRDTKKEYETRIRTVAFVIDKHFAGVRFSPEAFSRILSNLKKIIDEMHSKNNSKLKNMNLPEYSKKYLYESKTVISYMQVQNKIIPEEFYRICFSVTEMLFHDISLRFRFKDYVLNDGNVYTLEENTLKYIKKLIRD